MLLRTCCEHQRRVNGPVSAVLCCVCSTSRVAAARPARASVVVRAQAQSRREVRGLDCRAVDSSKDRTQHTAVQQLQQEVCKGQGTSSLASVERACRSHVRSLAVFRDAEVWNHSTLVLVKPGPA